MFHEAYKTSSAQHYDKYSLDVSELYDSHDYNLHVIISYSSCYPYNCLMTIC